MIHIEIEQHKSCMLPQRFPNVVLFPLKLMESVKIPPRDFIEIDYGLTVKNLPHRVRPSSFSQQTVGLKVIDCSEGGRIKFTLVNQNSAFSLSVPILEPVAIVEIHLPIDWVLTTPGKPGCLLTAIS